MQETSHPIRPIARFKISDSVAAQLEQLIGDGAYKLGERLPSERVLSEQFGVGRSSMREALRVLEARGLVSIAHGVGVHVTEPPVTGDRRNLLQLEGCTVPELFEVRRALEGPGAASAAKRVTLAEAARLKELLEEMEDPRLADVEFVEMDADLHRSIMLATHNALLIELYDTTRHLFVEYSARVIGFPGRRSTAHEGHAAIVDAIVRRRPQVAQKAMAAHLLAAEREIVENLDAAARLEETPGPTPKRAPRPRLGRT